MTDKTRQIIELRKAGKSYEDVAAILGCTLRSVRNIVQSYNCAYKDIENVWKEKVADLRREGYDYTDISEVLNVDHDKVEIFCRLNGLKYSDLGDSPYHKSSDKLKGRDVINWIERVNAVTDGNFRLISNKLNSKGEQSLIVECVKCGTQKTVSSISLRGKGRITCLPCRAELLAEKKTQREKADKEIKQWQKNYKRGKNLVQVEMNFCKCGKLLPFGRKICDACRQEAKRNIERRKEHKRRLRENREFDRTITLDKLYERDNGICYICNKTCDWSDFQKVNGAFVVGGSYPTVEHVKALCNGGTHTWDNIKLACHSCNSKKGRT